jgi:hypoxanthine phosphoribosyltransferase
MDCSFLPFIGNCKRKTRPEPSMSSSIFVTEDPSTAPLNSRIHDVRVTPNDNHSDSAIYPSLYTNHLSSLLLDHQTIQNRAREIATEIHSVYSHDEPLVMICILKGSSPFYHLLCQELSALGHPYMMDFYRMKSYEGTASSGNIKVMQALPESIVGRDVLVVEDIIDTGHTLKALVPTIMAKEPKSFRICSMLVKRLTEAGEVSVAEELKVEDRFIGFSIPNAFVVGCGLDFNEMYRDLRDVWILSEDGIKGGGYGL